MKTQKKPTSASTGTAEGKVAITQKPGVSAGEEILLRSFYSRHALVDKD